MTFDQVVLIMCRWQFVFLDQEPEKERLFKQVRGLSTAGRFVWASLKAAGYDDYVVSFERLI
ncbi:hypothetical protein [uncultured Tateyamaria sp.]|uniref:hypothetical protein n=1 Tax=uncultured Tateyamaria sp. TaxID=455651 RepID=UPI00261445D5|nr:hypothetical protein [uncultured Tateyamaria sp.]